MEEKYLAEVDKQREQCLDWGVKGSEVAMT